jgi:hypothetical protein
MASTAGTGGRLSRAVTGDRQMRQALHALGEQVAYAVDREYFGSELTARELAMVEAVVVDRLEDRLLSLRVPERPVVFT